MAGACSTPATRGRPVRRTRMRVAHGSTSPSDTDFSPRPSPGLLMLAFFMPPSAAQDRYFCLPPPAKPAKSRRMSRNPSHRPTDRPGPQAGEAALNPTLNKGPVNQRVPEGDNRPRLICDDCGFIHYDNPKIVVGAVCLHEDRILLCRRAIPPRIGYWTLPAGYLELNESTEAGAAREAFEEATARIEIERLLAV